MKHKKNTLLLFLLISSLLLLSGCGSSQGGVMDTAAQNAASSGESNLPAITWKMGSTWGSGNIHFTVDKRFSSLVSELTGGKFTITNYAEGELCSAGELLDYVENGTIQCGGDWGGYWSGKDTAFELLSTIMDDFSALDYYTWIYQAGGLNCYQNQYRQYNIQYFPIMVNGSESGIRSVKPITSISDMQKMKIRLGGVMAGRAAQKLGINITTVPASELYESLQRGVIDGGEFSGPWADDSLKLQEIAHYWCAPAWYQSAGVNGVMINMDAWNELPKEYQEAIQLAASTCTGEQLGRYTYNDMVTTNKMLQDGQVIINHLGEEDQATIRKVCKEVYEEECLENENFKVIYDSMMAYRQTANAYKEWVGSYGFGFNYEDADISGRGETEANTYDK